MSFIAIAPAPRTDPPQTVGNDGFFPDIDLADARETLRLDGTVTAARLRFALVGAMLEAGNSLAAWKAAQIASGYAQLKDVPARKIDGATRLEHAYRRAVYSLAKADLIERMTDYDAAAAGQKRAEWLDAAPDDHRRNARWAIADVMGRKRNIVDLI
ncbi:MAG: head completion/stabilization protein [Pigmentiphaga sp.]